MRIASKFCGFKLDRFDSVSGKYDFHPVESTEFDRLMEVAMEREQERISHLKVEEVKTYCRSMENFEWP